MVQMGVHLSDVPTSLPPAEHFDAVRRMVEAAQEAGFTHIAIGQHFLYGELRWLQPVPLLARLAADVDPHVRLATNIMVAPLYHPVLLAEELATLDVVTEGRFTWGCGLGYRPEEFDHLDVPFKQRASRFDEILELLPRLWTEDEVTHHGRHWQLEGVRPHLRPVQDPHPPIWVGAQALPGVRRAARYADAYACSPEATVAEIAERHQVVMDGFAARGKAFTPQPVRRNGMVADTTEQARAEFARVAQGRYVAYAQTGFDAMDLGELERRFLDTVADHAVIGTPDEVVAQLTDLATRLPVDPIVWRPGWPSMSADEVCAAIRRLGRDVVPGVRELEARTTIEPSAFTTPTH
ncbi:LLM class flavin-dependent oxidoreductase [Nocardioides anomalus]|uniref:LLM class flavin-dependent oxidoreductase n=1 Tax=Nocardioides anomalus TaxID=2712223 RepID=A0A6G6WH13_9ACTN|nr:LLM class flavin-dependent oxidoreductase [Nocardioides anomalus]QIG44618.1 LLM class flavin-dependent oxidoreductase [Nocardioides anomalus]